MSDLHHHHQQHRPQRLSVPLRFPHQPISATTTTPSTSTSRPYPLYASSTPTPTPSKHRRLSLTKRSSSNSLSSLFLLSLLSLRSLYSLLPFLRSSPSFSLFPFSFLISLSSFLLTLAFSFHSVFSLSQITLPQIRLLAAKSVLLAAVFLLRFQALRYCGTAATILAEFSGNVAARFAAGDRNGNAGRGSQVRGFLALIAGLFLLSVSWDRIECFPLSNLGNGGFLLSNCLRVSPMLLPFLSGFLGCYERVSMNWGSIRQLGRKRVRLISLLFTTLLLFVPAVVSFFLIERDGGDGVSIGSLGWPLVNTVVFGVFLIENYGDEKLANSKDFQREFAVTFVCTVVLELFYFPELSLWGLLLCGFLLWISVRELDPISSNYPELGLDSSGSFSSMVMKPFRHILSERKSRKIALFLLINTAYMVVEFVAGFMSNSLGLISDACHMLFDCAALAIGLYASYISRLPANGQFNYGRGRFEVLSGYVNAVFLVLVGALIVLESFERILDPQEISTNSLLTVSIGGLVVNMVGLVFFHEEHHHAHGGAGSCSHSHADPHSHNHNCHTHNHSVHDHGSHGDHHNHGGISITHEKSFGAADDHHCHDHVHLGHHDHNDHDHHDESRGGCKNGETIIHHDHHCQSGLHDPAREHDQHDEHHLHHHHHHKKHADQNSISASSSLLKHSHEDCPNAEFHADGDDCCPSHIDHPSSSHGHELESDCHDHSSLGSTVPQPIEPLLERKQLKEPEKHHHIDHNMEGIFLHVLADTMGSVGVVISTLLIKYKGWLVADPACSIFISVLIVSSVISLLRNSAEILLQRVPRAHEQDLKVALNDVMRVSGVHSVENVHVWSLTNTDVVGTVRVRVNTDADKASTKSEVSHILHSAGIKDLTIQMEYVRGK